jgi:hypothetical protein
MLLVRRISSVLGFVGNQNRVAALCVFAAIAGFLVAPAVAQQGVSCGMVETAEGPQFWGACPSQGSKRQAPPDRYAAIAVSNSTLKSGSSWNAKSQSEAERLALVYCHKQGASDCKIELWARNACVALAASAADGSGTFSTGWSPNRAQANSIAVAACHRIKGKRCTIQQSRCPQDP